MHSGVATCEASDVKADGTPVPSRKETECQMLPED